MPIHLAGRDSRPVWLLGLAVGWLVGAKFRPLVVGTPALEATGMAPFARWRDSRCPLKPAAGRPGPLVLVGSLASYSAVAKLLRRSEALIELGFARATGGGGALSRPPG